MVHRHHKRIHPRTPAYRRHCHRVTCTVLRVCDNGVLTSAAILPKITATSVPHRHLVEEHPAVVSSCGRVRLHRDGRGVRGTVEHQLVIPIGIIAWPIIGRLGVEYLDLLPSAVLVHRYLHPTLSQRLIAIGVLAPPFRSDVHRERLGQIQRNRSDVT